MFTNYLNPVLLQWQFITIRWYGLFLAIGVLLSVLILIKLSQKNNLPKNIIFDLCIWLIIGGLIGARLGYVIFYQLNYYLTNPIEIFFVNHGGLSSHGLTLGLIVSLLIFSKIKKISLRNYIDILIIPIPLLATFIRLGNFFNSEIVGRATDLPWGVYFTNYENNPILRHPTQLYEALFTMALFFTLYSLFKKLPDKTPKLFFFHLFLLTYFSGRFLLEFTKEYQVNWENFFTAGQWLSLPFIIYATYWFIKNKKTPMV